MRGAAIDGRFNRSARPSRASLATLLSADLFSPFRPSASARSQVTALLNVVAEAVPRLLPPLVRHSINIMSDEHRANPAFSLSFSKSGSQSSVADLRAKLVSYLYELLWYLVTHHLRAW